jgi:serine/threonine-protein kinase PknK
LEQPEQLVAEYDNFRLALLWFDTRDEVEALLPLTATLAREWMDRGLLREGLDRIERVLGRIRDTPSAARVQVLHAAAVMAVYQGNHERAAPFIEESLAVAQDVADPFLIGQSLTLSGWLLYRRGEYQRADEQLGEARHLLQGMSDPVRASPVIIISGDNKLVQEHFVEARLFYEHTIDVNQGAGPDWLLSDALAGLAGVHYCTGDVRQAAALYAEGLHHAPVQHVTVQLVSALLGLAAVAASTGHSALGARLLGAAEGLAESIGARIFPRDFPVRRRALAALATALGENQLAAELATGRNLTREQAVATAQIIVAETDAMLPAQLNKVDSGHLKSSNEDPAQI